MYPVLVQFQGVTFYTYGTVMLLSLILIYVLAARRIDKAPFNREQLDDLGLIIMVSIWVGAGVTSLLLTKPEEVTQQLLEVLRGGKLQKVSTLSIALAVALLMLSYCRWKKLSLTHVSDFLMPFFILGYAVQRTLGCFSAGCCYGQGSDLLWAVRFPSTLGTGTPTEIPLHPTQLYLGITAFLTYGLMRLWEKHSPPSGTITCLGLIGLFGFYFLIAFVRGDLATVQQVGGMPANQLLAGILSIVGMTGFIWFWKREIKTEKKGIRKVGPRGVTPPTPETLGNGQSRHP